MELKILLDQKAIIFDNIDNNTLLTDIQKDIEKVYYNNKYRRQNKKNKIWWDKSLDFERNGVRALRRQYQHEQNNELRLILWEKFKKAHAKYKKNILIKKRNSFKEFVSNITTSNTFGSAYKIV